MGSFGNLFSLGGKTKWRSLGDGLFFTSRLQGSVSLYTINKDWAYLNYLVGRRDLDLRIDDAVLKPCLTWQFLF